MLSKAGGNSWFIAFGPIPLVPTFWSSFPTVVVVFFPDWNYFLSDKKNQTTNLLSTLCPAQCSMPLFLTGALGCFMWSVIVFINAKTNDMEGISWDRCLLRRVMEDHPLPWWKLTPKTEDLVLVPCSKVWGEILNRTPCPLLKCNFSIRWIMNFHFKSKTNYFSKTDFFFLRGQLLPKV